MAETPESSRKRGSDDDDRASTPTKKGRMGLGTHPNDLTLVATRQTHATPRKSRGFCFSENIC